MTLRKDLCADSLIRNIGDIFSSVPDSRSQGKSVLPIRDVLMSGFALFSLKKSSLLAFDQGRADPCFRANMKSLYGVNHVACDTQMREVLDKVDPDNIRPAFVKLFASAQRGKVLESYGYLNGKYLVALDGTGYFSSKTIHCNKCLTKISKKTGEVTYHHQMVGAVVVHPDQKQVIPLCPEPILQQDGNKKNDCERNAIARWLKAFRKEHPKLDIIITEDGLSSNAPHIRALIDHRCSFILGAKPGDHAHLFEKFHLARSLVTEIIRDSGGVKGTFRFVNGLSLNESNADVIVNMLHYVEETKKGTKVFTWVTDIELNSENVFDIMRGGRARWKVENETFNTLKNQGYNFEHNYGHGENNLSVVLAFLMFLAFAVDQLQMASCKVFQAAAHTSKTLKRLWVKIMSWFELTPIPDWENLLRVIADKTSASFPNTS